MIKNIILDIGNVLAAFRWRELFGELGFEGEVFERVADATVRGPFWPEYDRSSLSDEEIHKGCRSLAPDLEKEVMAVFEHVGEICRPFDYSCEWIASLKAAGYKIYILSNYGRTGFEAVRKYFTFLDLADGRVISYEVQAIKPERAVFKALEVKYGILPEESVFFDDMKENVDAAVSYGYHAVQFQSKEQAEAALTMLMNEET